MTWGITALPQKEAPVDIHEGFLGSSLSSLRNALVLDSQHVQHTPNRVLGASTRFRLLHHFTSFSL
ncbi:hypothetical protein DDJ61_03310 [Mycobacteroides abscessus]|nr:hypothetical protein DDJ61_03310 [Mycobacteroides abscessus]